MDTWLGMLEMEEVVLLIGRWVRVKRMTTDIGELGQRLHDFLSHIFILFVRENFPSRASRPIEVSNNP